MTVEHDEQQRQESKVKRFFKAVFVHNIGWKLLALGTSIVIWVLAAGLW